MAVFSKQVKKLIIGVMKALDIYSIYLLRVGGVPREDGWFRSFREERSVDLDGNPIPWLTYPAIAFIARRIRPDMSVFEYGCGSSTLWWAQRVKEVVACEHDREWYRSVVTKVPDNATVHHVPLEYGGEYCHKVSATGKKFDIVVVDGRDRVNCVRNAVGSLAPGGVFIWDNSDREEYREGYQLLFDQGFKKIEFTGMIPIMSCRSETGIFYRQENCLGI